MTWHDRASGRATNSALLFTLLLALGGCPATEPPPTAPAAPPAKTAKAKPPAPAKVVVEQATLTAGDTVKVIKLIKGDEIVVEKEGRPATVRLLGIDSFHNKIQDPDMAGMHQAVMAFLGEKILNQEVTVTFGKTVQDKRGRYLGIVKKDEEEINRLLVGEGFVLVYSEYGFGGEEDYLNLEREARPLGKNIWGNPRLSSLATARRKSWAKLRKMRDGNIPSYYLASEVGDEAEEE